MDEKQIHSASKKEVLQVLEALIDSAGGRVRMTEVTAGASISVTLKLPVSSSCAEQKALAESLLVAASFVMSNEV
jgi:hypothetical protein